MNDDTTQVRDMGLLALHGLAVKKAGQPSPSPTSSAVTPARSPRPSTTRRPRAGRWRPRACSWSPRPGARGSTSSTPRPSRTSAPTRTRRGLRALRADQPRAAHALHRLADDARGGDERVPNDHSDADYDAGIVDRLGAQHERAEKVLGRFAALEPRLGVYTRRLESAYDKVLAGEHDWVSGARIDSYHTVWFELHEDLLRMLGPRARGGAVTTVSERIVVLDGSASVAGREVVGNKGASIARMRALGLPVPPAFVPPDRGVPPLPRRRRRARRGGVGGGPGRRGRARARTRAAASATPSAAARLRPLGRRGEHAGDDGHGPQPRHRPTRSRRALAELSGDAAFARATHVRFIHEFGHTVLGADLDEPGDDATADEVRAAVRRDTGEDVPADRTSSCAPRSARSSARGRRAARWPTASTGASPRTAAPR